MAHLRKGTTAVRNGKAPDHLNKLNNNVSRFPASRDRFGTIIKTLDAVTRSGPMTPEMKERLKDAKALANTVKAEAERNGNVLSRELAELRLRQAIALRRSLDEALQQMNEPVATIGVDPKAPKMVIDTPTEAMDVLTAVIGFLVILTTRHKDRKEREGRKAQTTVVA